MEQALCRKRVGEKPSCRYGTFQVLYEFFKVWGFYPTCLGRNLNNHSLRTQKLHVVVCETQKRMYMSSREHRRSLWRKLFASLAGVAVTASALVGIDSTVNIQPAYADDPMLCNGNGIYTHHSTGEIREFREVGPEKWDFSPAGDFHITNQQDNALGVSN